MIHDLTLVNYTGVIISNAIDRTGLAGEGLQHGEQRVQCR
jgi:hypothetical protein